MNISLYSKEECEKIAREASLRYLTDGSAGISRKKKGRGFTYFAPDGSRIKDPSILKRIKKLAVPPAYTNVWISPYKNSHLQATGQDVKNRKQYIYHPLWRAARQQQKFNLLQHFGKSLPLIRNFVQKELNKSLQMHKLQIICAIVYILDNFSIRIGNSIYSKQNQSFGITTLRKKHLSIEENRVILDFKGKNAQMWHVLLKNKKIIRLLKKCTELPGYELFKYQDDDGDFHIISSQDVNGFLHDLTKKPFTAKDFRTWAASREFFYSLIQIIQKKKITNEQYKVALNEVAKKLGHTPSICQKSYLHPQIIAGWKNKILEKWLVKHIKNVQKLNKDDLFLHWLRTYRNIK